MQHLTIFNISAEQLRINEMLEESGGELTPEIEEALTLNQQNFAIKSEGYIESIARYEALSEAAAERIKQLQGYKRTADNIRTRLKERLAYGMQMMGYPSIDVGLHKVSLRTTSSVNITDEARIPAEFIKVETKVDKKRIGDAIKSGELVTGAELITKQTIQIR